MVRLQPLMNIPGTGKLEAQRALENVAVGDNTAAAPDEALLQQAELQAQDPLRNDYLVMTGQRSLIVFVVSGTPRRTLHGLVPGFHGPHGEVRADRGIEQKSTRWCCGRLDLNPRKCIQGPEVSNAKSRISPTTLVKQWTKSCIAGCSPHKVKVLHKGRTWCFQAWRAAGSCAGSNLYVTCSGAHSSRY